MYDSKNRNSSFQINIYNVCIGINPNITEDSIDSVVRDAKIAVKDESKRKLFNVFCERCQRQRRGDHAENLRLFEDEYTRNPDTFLYGKLLRGRIRKILHERYHISHDLLRVDDALKDLALERIRIGTDP